MPEAGNIHTWRGIINEIPGRNRQLDRKEHGIHIGLNIRVGAGKDRESSAWRK
jgi:hypothetical protein